MKVLMLLMVGNARAASDFAVDDILGYSMFQEKRNKSQEGEG